MRDCGEHRLNRRSDCQPARALTGQPDQRGAVTIVGHKPARADLCAGGLGLRRRKHPQRARPAPLKLARERPVQRARRFNRKHRVDTTDKPGELLNPSPRVRDRDRLADQPPLAIGQPHPMRHLARIDRHHNTIAPKLSEQPRHQTPPLTEDQRERPTPPGSRPQLNTVPRDLSAHGRSPRRWRAPRLRGAPPRTPGRAQRAVRPRRGRPRSRRRVGGSESPCSPASTPAPLSARTRGSDASLSSATAVSQLRPRSHAAGRRGRCRGQRPGTRASASIKRLADTRPHRGPAAASRAANAVSVPPP